MLPIQRTAMQHRQTRRLHLHVPKPADLPPAESFLRARPLLLLALIGVPTTLAVLSLSSSAYRKQKTHKQRVRETDESAPVW